MSNMSYCRFRNTLPDLQDCYDHLWDNEETEEYEGLSPEESAARKQLIDLCKWISEQFEENE